MCIKLKINQGYTMMHGQPIIKNYLYVRWLQLHLIIENIVAIYPWALNRIPRRCGRDDVQIHHWRHCVLRLRYQCPLTKGSWCRIQEIHEEFIRLLCSEGFGSTDSILCSRTYVSLKAKMRGWWCHQLCEEDRLEYSGVQVRYMNILWPY